MIVTNRRNANVYLRYYGISPSDVPIVHFTGREEIRVRVREYDSMRFRYWTRRTVLPTPDLPSCHFVPWQPRSRNTPRLNYEPLREYYAATHETTQSERPYGLIGYTRR